MSLLEIPGPRPWPLVGNLPNIDLENSIQSIVNIGKQYGTKFLIFLLHLSCVRLNSKLNFQLQARFVDFVWEARTNYS